MLNTPPATATPQPQPTPSAFAASNVFEYGQAPQNNFANSGDAPQIFYARLSPTVMTASTSVSVDAITTTNITRMHIGTATSVLSLTQVASGKWQGSFQAARFSLGPAQPLSQLILSAYRSDGTAATVQIPVTPH